MGDSRTSTFSEKIYITNMLNESKTIIGDYGMA